MSPKTLKQENNCKNNYHECVKDTHQICRPEVLISASHLRSSFDHLCAGRGVVRRVAGNIQIARPVSKKDRHPDCSIEERSGPGPAHQRCAHNETHHGRNPQCRHVYRPQPCNICAESIHTALHTNPPDPEGHAGDAQCEADPLLDSNDRGERNLVLFIRFFRSLLPSSSRCGH
jgi:hypothetical protein